jgi:hypothetical protein
MFLAILVVVPSLLATWVSYWSTKPFKSLSNRASRIVSLISPVRMAVTTGIILGVSGTDLPIPDLTAKYAAAALLLAVTLSLILPTLLLAFLVGKLSHPVEAIR